MGFPVFFDTCVLFGEVVNDVILRLAEELLFTPYWSGDVLDELERNLTPRIEEVRAQRRICAILRQSDSTHQDAQ
ncbi:hypothetical protein BAAA27672_07875 [Bifidobacterium animalis subsp. animalis ATCC 27672]|nr:PIN domain-containing protein [Bifidobacterium animalis]KOA53898.1 hypothetical protein BAAA27672_07875 [Bifidobacterium animalis subsp. animalis ATCC 27672]